MVQMRFDRLSDDRNHAARIPRLSTGPRSMTSQLGLFGPPASLPVVLNDDWPADYAVRFLDAAVRKVDKLDAMKALDRVRKRGVPWAVLFPAWVRYNRDHRDTERRFIRHPTTWLNKGSYDNGDEGNREDRTAAAGHDRSGGAGYDPVMAGMGNLARPPAGAQTGAAG